MVDPLGRQGPNVLPGEHSHSDHLRGLVVTVAVIPAARRLAPPVLHLPPPPTLEEAPGVVVVVAAGVELLLVLTARVKGALPVPAVVEVDLVDGEVAHVVQPGPGGPVQADQLVVPAALPPF